MKHSHLITAIASITLSLTAIANAEQAPQASANKGEHHQHHMFNVVEATQKHLNLLKSKLALNNSQTSAWDAFASYKLEKAKEFQERWAHHKEGHHHPDFAKLTAPEIIDLKMEHTTHHIERLEARKITLLEEKKVTEALYQTLSPLQKNVFDLYNQQHHGHHHPHGHGWKFR